MPGNREPGRIRANNHSQRDVAASHLVIGFVEAIAAHRVDFTIRANWFVIRTRV
jgi:hypothetical protein